MLQKWVEINHCSGKITLKFVILACNPTYVQTMLLRISNLHFLTQVAYKETFLPKLSYFTSKLSHSHQTYVLLPCIFTHIQKLMFRVSNLCSLIQITYKKKWFKPVMYEKKPFSTKIKLFYVKTRLFFFLVKITSFCHVTPPMYRNRC